MERPVAPATTMAVVVVVAAVVACAAATGAQKPNIIFVVADDLGWNDVGWHNPSMLTPNLDRYAKQGVILNNSYVQYFCSPSRNCFMTGYFPYHTGLQSLVIMPGEPRFVPLNFTMLPQLMKTAGYATHIVGKWHLGMCNWKYTPTYRGFDSFFGYYLAYEDYYTHKTNGGYDLRNNTQVAEDPSSTYFDYLFTKQAVNVIDKHDTDTPLYLYLPFHLCHGPLQIPAKYENMYRHINTKDRRTYCGMVSMMDESFGNITDALDRRGLLDNTLIIFTTDNGGPVIAGANNWPLRGSKGTFWEGGTRGAAFVWSKDLLHKTAYNGGPVAYGANNWPLRGAKATFWEGGTRGAAFVWSKDLLHKTAYVNNEMMHAVDWFPTILHLAGLQAEKGIDGVNQWDMLSSGAASNRDEFVYNIDIAVNSTAIRYKDYKLMTGSPGQYNDWYPVPTSTREEQARHNEQDDKPAWKPQLYNIRLDPEERHDLADSDPDMLKFMLTRLESWMATGVPPQTARVDPKSDPTLWGGFWTPGWC